MVFTTRPTVVHGATTNSRNTAKGSTLRSLMYESVYQILDTNESKKATAVSLSGLGKAAVNKIVSAALIPPNSGFSVSKELNDQVFNKTDGFPLHVILLLRWLPENDAIELDDNKVWRLKGKKVGQMVLRSEATVQL